MLKTRDEVSGMRPKSNPFGASREDHQDFVDRFRQGPQAISQEEGARLARPVAQLIVIAECDTLISSASAYSREHLEHMPKIRDWNWNS